MIFPEVNRKEKHYHLFPQNREDGSITVQIMVTGGYIIL